MRINKLFTFGLAALALAACSNDDEITNGGAQGQEGAVIDAISISFANSSPATRADKGEVEGMGSEDAVYVAYIFAKENDPQHDGVKVGDWTVKRVAGKTATDANSDVDADITKAIVAGNIATPGSKLNMATFNGVRQGDSVYVVVNDENMNLANASALAHQGDKSQKAIRQYVSNITKKYLDDMTVKKNTDQKKHFIMAGANAIPTNPNTPNGGTITVPVSLDRELAKAYMSVTVTADENKEAFKKIEIKPASAAGKFDGDGLVVVRIPRKVAPFTQQSRDWYFPLTADVTAKDWDVAAQLNVFDGVNELLGWRLPDVAPTAGKFNATVYSPEAKEYRMTWRLKDVNGANDMVTLKDGILASPYFYVTPNYANNSGCATVIVTQATYVGAGALESILTAEMLAAAYADATVSAPIKVLDANAISYDKVSSATWLDTSVMTPLLVFLNANYKEAITGSAGIDVSEKAITITTGDKRFYRADIANYSADETTSMKITERNTFYQTSATITTLGAKTIEDAINSDDLGMLVQVKVNKWKYKVNDIEM